MSGSAAFAGDTTGSPVGLPFTGVYRSTFYVWLLQLGIAASVCLLCALWFARRAALRLARLPAALAATGARLPCDAGARGFRPRVLVLAAAGYGAGALGVALTVALGAELALRIEPQVRAPRARARRVTRCAAPRSSWACPWCSSGCRCLRSRRAWWAGG